MKNKGVIGVLVIGIGVLLIVYSGILKQYLNGGQLISVESDQIAENIVLSQEYTNKGNLIMAEKILRRNLKIINFDEQTYYWLSVVLILKKDFKGSFEYAKPLVEKSTDPKILTDLGSLFALSDYEKMALVCYVKAIKENSGFIPAYIELGKLYGNQEKFIQAINVWQDALRLEPHNKELQGLIKQAYEMWNVEVEGG